MFIPTAIACPPNLSIVSLHSINASCKSNPGILLPDPLHSPSSSHNKILGLKYSSVIFDETIPITP